MSPPKPYPNIPEDPSIQVFALQLKIDLETLIKEQQITDSVCSKLKDIYTEILTISPDLLTKNQENFLKVYQEINGFMYHKSASEQDWKLYVPDSMTKQIIDNYHNYDVHCHPGVDAICTLIRQYFAWPKMKSCVSNYLKACKVCIQVKVAGRVKVAPLRPTAETRKLRKWSLGIMGPYVPSRKYKNKYIITLVDPCSKWTEAKSNHYEVS